MSTRALVLALGGTSAYAANTIRSRDIVDGQVERVDRPPRRRLPRAVPPGV